MADKISFATLALAKAYTDESIEGVGAIKGKNCEIQSIEPITGGNRVTFAWYDGSDILKSGTMDVMDGEDGAEGDPGKGIKSMAINAQNHLIITYDDDTTQDAGLVPSGGGDVQSVNGKSGVVVLDAEDVGALPDSAAIPEKTSDLNNDSGFITNTVNNLANYYLKAQTYTQTEVDALIAAVKNGRFISVATLPTTDIDTKAIYLVPSADPQTTNIKDEYINLDGTSLGWELIGSTEIDLSGYVTDAELTTALADYTTTTDLTTLLSGKQDTLTIDNEGYINL